MNKKIISSIVAFTVVLQCVPLHVFASGSNESDACYDVVATENFETGEYAATNADMLTVVSVAASVSGDYEYTVNSDGASVTLTDYCGNHTDLTVPAVLDGYSVSSIGNNAFSSCSTLKEVVLPDTITSIGRDAFNGCVNLRSIVIPEGVTTIGRYAFYKCSNLEKITLPSTLTSISYNVFDDCVNLNTAGPIGGGYDIEFGWETEIPADAFNTADYLVSVVLPDTITSIRGDAFSGCVALENISFPSDLELIDSRAFENCPSLTSITLPETLEIISDHVFKNCIQLADVNLPESLHTIGRYAFENCALRKINLPESLCKYRIHSPICTAIQPHSAAHIAPL